MNKLDFRTNEQIYQKFNSNEKSSSIEITPQDEILATNDPQAKKIEDLTNEVASLRKQLDEANRSSNKKILDDITPVEEKEEKKQCVTSKTLFSVPLDEKDIVDLFVKINSSSSEGETQTFIIPKALLKEIPIYRSIEKFSDSKVLDWKYPEKIDDAVISSFLQSVLCEFFCQLTLKTQQSSTALAESIVKKPENLEIFLALHDQKCMENRIPISYLKNSFIQYCLQDSTGKHLIDCIKLACKPDYALIKEAWIEAMEKLKLQHANNKDQLSVIHNNFARYRQERKQTNPEEDTLIKLAVFQFSPFEKFTDKQLANFYYRKGNIFQKLEKYNEALEAFYQAKLFFSKSSPSFLPNNEPTYVTSNVRLAIGETHFKLKHFGEAIEIYKNPNDDIDVVGTFHDVQMRDCYLATNQLEEALGVFSDPFGCDKKEWEYIFRCYETRFLLNTADAKEALDELLQCKDLEGCMNKILESDPQNAAALNVKSLL